MDNFLGKYNLTTWTQEENKNLNTTKPVKKKNPKLKIYPQKPVGCRLGGRTESDMTEAT